MWVKHLKTQTLAIILLLAAPMIVQAQARPTVKSLDQRVQRIERVLDQSMLHQLQRVDTLQGEIRELRGEIENLNHDVETLKKRNRNLYRDTDKRITDLEARPAGGLGLDGGLDGEGLDDGLDGGLDELGDEPSDSANLSSNSQPAAVITKPRAAAGNNTRPATAAEKSAYTKAYDLLARGQNDAAIAAFDKFIGQYSDGPYADNAWYWQGEAKYAQRDFNEALRNFNFVVGSFPGSPKVPDARLKIGFALYEQQRFAEAREVLTGVQNDYPGRSAAVLARKRLQKMDREGR
ncbi:MAG: tol-pal system protein YbgF [Granulosicoccaceae bacterium]